MYLLDTNILSEITKRNPNETFIKKLRAVPSPAIFTAVICVMELRHGAMKRGNPSDFWLMIEQQILSKIRILFNSPLARQEPFNVVFVRLE
jgi:predicted nucleic acid-binding protein